MQTSVSREIFRFGDFELDVAAYELRRHGRPVKLGRQQMDLLLLLVESRRQLVSRTDIVDRLWGKDVFVDVETGVNTAISKVRQALRDSPRRSRVCGDRCRQGVSLHRGRRGGLRCARHQRAGCAARAAGAGAIAGACASAGVRVRCSKSEAGSRDGQTSAFVLQTFSSGSCDWPGRRDDGDRARCLEAAQRRRGRPHG